MIIDKLNRRMFLQGSGKLLVSIPFLTSLSRLAEAASSPPPRFIFISAQNGGQLPHQWFPTQSQTGSNLLYTAGSGRGAHYYTKDPLAFAADTGISPIFDSKFNSFVPKMNFVRGLDQRFAPFGNHRGAPLLGNVNSAHASVGFCPAIPTIDQLMAYSDGFYPNDGLGYVRSLSINPLKSIRNTSFNFSNPYKKEGKVVAVPSTSNPHTLFYSLFENSAALAEGKTTPMVDDIIEDYKRVRNSRRLSSAEKLKLDEVIDTLAQVESKLSVDVVPDRPACRNLNAPESIHSSTDGKEDEQLGLIIDMLMLALQCDRTRVITLHFNYAGGNDDGNSHSSPSWHWSSHNASAGNPTAEAKLLEIYKWIADNALHPLVSRMNSASDADGNSILDNSLVHFATSSMSYAHNNLDLPTLLFGSAGGFFETGHFIDYRDLTTKNNTGILHNQYLTNVMTAMGLTKDQWNMSKLGLTASGFDKEEQGYGWYKRINGAKADSSWDRSESKINLPLPGLITASGLSRFS